MFNTCENCGGPIRVNIFRGGRWCSENCRKALERKELIQSMRSRCTYEPVWTDEVGTIDVCVVHKNNSKYGPERGEHRPCLTVEGY